jgi:peptide/nickel transport system permease protein
METMEEDFVTALRATGMKENKIFFRRILRNALLPVVTIGGIYVGFLFSGALLTETIWGWPGMGKLTYQAIASRDYPLILGAFFLTSLFVLIVTLVVDVLYAFLDPRIRYGGERK